MSDYDSILVTFSGDVATLTINRPERLNALTPAALAEIARALDEVVARGARALVMTGAGGRAFSSGADLMGEKGEVGVPDDLGALVADHFNPVVRKLAALPIPVVSAVSGLAAGAGCSLALHADFVVAGKSAYFLLAFVNIGLVPDAGATWLFAKAVGRARALEMAMLGERLYAERAQTEGLIYRVVADEAVMDEAEALAQRLARGPTLALGMIRRSVSAALAGSLEDVLEIETVDQRLAGFSADAKEGIAAFVEKRPARFTGA